ncbi:MAG: TonB-dependent receptor [Deltaproteobacteria bacterium]|nr:TonB-dependent receptor [Deltaproteobacteria bacterium]
MRTNLAASILTALALVAGTGRAEPAAVTPPVLLHNVEPEYPPEALKQKLSATVLLVLEIDATGKVTAATVKESAGNGFDEAAQQAALQLEFTPATRQGKNVPSRILYRTSFELKQSELKQQEPVAVTPSTPEPPAPKKEDPATAPKEVRPIEVSVRGEKPDRELTRRTMGRQELSLVPGTSGDALRAVQAMPSIARTNAFTGMLIVRGSSPAGTAVFVDGTPIPTAYHFGGLSSVVPTEMLEAIDFFPGNFSARYGRVNGGIVNVRLREIPRDGKYHGLAQVDLIDARVMLNGPVPLMRNWSFQVAARRSHLDAWVGSLMGDFASVRKAPVYYDWQAFAETRPTETSLLRTGMFGSDDRLALLLNDAIPQDPGMGSSLSQRTAMMRWQTTYRNTVSEQVSISATASVGLDRDVISFGAIQADSTTHPIAARGELAVKLKEGMTLRTGPDLVFSRYHADVRTVLPPDTSAPDPGPLSARPLLTMHGGGWVSTPAAYAELEWIPQSRLKLLYGGRVDHHQLTGKTDVSPRLNARYDLRKEFPRSTAKAGVGLFHEPPQLVEVYKVFGTPTLRSNRAVHYSLGVEQELTQAVDVSIEGFYKDLDNLVVRQGQADGSLGYDNLGKGRVYGAELLLRHRPMGGFFGWVAYTLSRSTRVDAPGRAEHLFEYDQTHILTVLGSYDLGLGWRLGARFRLVSGNPYTPCLGGVQNAGSGTYACRTGSLFGERLPPFHQADLRVDKTWRFDAWNLTAYLDVQNVYNRSNPEAMEYNYNYTRTRYQAGLPILPSLGLRGEF